MAYKITMGLWDNLEGFVVIPFQANWVTNAVESGPNGERNAAQGGLGDINLTLKYRFVEERELMPNITALFTTSFPTGRFRNLNPSLLGIDAIGGGSYIFTTGLNLSKYLKPFVFYGNFWYSMQTAYSDDGGRVYPRDFVTVNLAAEYPFTKKWVALLELTSFWDGGRLFGHQANTPPGALLSILPGIEFMATEKFSLAFGVNVDLAGKNSRRQSNPDIIHGLCLLITRKEDHPHETPVVNHNQFGGLDVVVLGGGRPGLERGPRPGLPVLSLCALYVSGERYLQAL